MQRPSLTTNSRFWILLATVLIAKVVWIIYAIIPSSIEFSPLVRTYALLGACMLIATLLITPVTLIFRDMPYKAELIHARRALGVSAFFFAALHASLAFFEQLGGFSGFRYLTLSYQVAVIAGATALLILLLLACTSFDASMRYLGRWWKALHRFVYLAAILATFHALRIGTLFTDLKAPQARLGLLVIAALVIFQAVRIDTALRSRTRLATIAAAVAVAFTLGIYASAASTTFSLHSQHVAQAVQVQQQVARGDSTKRYSLNITTNPTIIQPGTPVTVRFQVFDAASGAPVDRFTKFYERFLHLIIVDSSLEFFDHVHPDPQADGTLLLTYTFPRDGQYHLYANFQPYLATEQQMAVTLTVGKGTFTAPSAGTTSLSAVCTSGDYTLTLGGVDALRAATVSVGSQSFTATVTKAGQSVTDLEPYLGAFAHLTLINTSTYEAVHVHPLSSVAVPAPTDRAGPTVTFTPLGLYGPIKPGVYRAFIEMLPGGTYQLFTTTISIGS